ncbi:MAG TPA: hypothetical protein VLO09_03610, partial [Ornithinimicrobium sp.]|nr:hypothetical protein [Ornithinimicrobium sp.]
WPGALLVASGGVHSPATVRAAVEGGASAIQLGTALWADPTLLSTLRAAVEARPAAAPGPRPVPDRRIT